MEKKEEILRVRNLDISFETTAGVVNAVRGVNLTVNRGETVAIVGESGSGKSVSAKAIMGILAKNGTIDRGQITFSYYRNPEERVTREIMQMKKEEIRRPYQRKTDRDGLPGSDDLLKPADAGWETDHGRHDLALPYTEGRGI